MFNPSCVTLYHFFIVRPTSFRLWSVLACRPPIIVPRPLKLTKYHHWENFRILPKVTSTRNTQYRSPLELTWGGSIFGNCKCQSSAGETIDLWPPAALVLCCVVFWCVVLCFVLLCCVVLCCVVWPVFSHRSPTSSGSCQNSISSNH